MKFVAAALFLLTFSEVVSGQMRKVPLDKSFIESTIDYYYTAQARQHPGTAVFYIEKDSTTINIKSQFSTFKVEYLSADEAAQRLPNVRKESVKLDRLMIKWITFDTIDVVISGCTIGERKVKQMLNNQSVTRTERFLTNCTENFVDVPTCRFVYDRSSMKWSQINRGKYVKN